MLPKNSWTQYILLFLSGFIGFEIFRWLSHNFLLSETPIYTDFAVPYTVQLSPEKLSAGSVWVKKSMEDKRNISRKAVVVTPTYQRKQQIPELIRIAQALYPVRRYIKEWVIVEEYNDNMVKNEMDKEDYEERRKVALKSILDYFQIPIQFMSAKKQLRLEKKFRGRLHTYVGSGLNSRRVALKYLQEDDKLTWNSGVLYWVDDDNVYDSEIFTWSENITTVGIWPVSAMRKGVVSSPVIRDGSVASFFDDYQGRRFSVDFAGFATNIKLLENVKTFFKGQGSIRGLMESSFLHSLDIDKTDLRPFGDNCTRAVAWHTKTKLVRVGWLGSG